MYKHISRTSRSCWRSIVITTSMIMITIGNTIVNWIIISSCMFTTIVRLLLLIVWLVLLSLSIIITNMINDKYVWEERFYTPPPPGNNLRDCKCARIETKVSIHHPLWVVVVYRIGLPNIINIQDYKPAFKNICIYCFYIIITILYY